MPQKYVLLCSFEIFHYICGVEMLKVIKSFAFFSVDNVNDSMLKDLKMVFLIRTLV